MNNLHPTDTKELNIKNHKCFFVGGVKQKIDNKDVIKGTMYVEQLTPKDLKPNHKIILIHGGGQTGVGFLGGLRGEMFLYTLEREYVFGACTTPACLWKIKKIYWILCDVLYLFCKIRKRI